MADDVAEFVGITATSPEVARRVLDMCGGDVEQAISLWFNDEDLQRSMKDTADTAADASTTSAAAAVAAPADPIYPHQSRENPQAVYSHIGREDARGVIHLDSDDEEDPTEQVVGHPMEIDDDNDDEEVGAVQAARTARTAQEDEDAAMAKRLQEELYAQQPELVDEEGVRAPIARTTEMLVAPSGPYGGDEEDDIQSLVLEQMRRRQQRQARPTNNPFSQSIWDDSTNSVLEASATSSRDVSQASRFRARLAELFRPPYDLMARLPWDEARAEGKDKKKWILVNLQDMSDFACQALNRDIWRDDAIKDLVKENFLFLQYNKDDMAAQQYISFYFPSGTHENLDNYPHVSIVDPRTGEQVKAWSGRPFPDAVDFHAQLAEFLDRYSLAANSKNPVVQAKRPEKSVDVGRLTEEEMLELAIQNSMAGANGAPSGGSNVHDPDSLTKRDANGDGLPEPSSGPAPIEEASPAAEPSSSADQPSRFSQVSSDRPHAEPDNNPATTTRIQFRHPEGRVIRRFLLTDPVERIYEWLKAEPLPGKEGIELELKVMPQGHDLIADLERTIGDAGLKNGTVMIEFVQ